MLKATGAMSQQSLMDDFDRVHTGQKYRALSSAGLAIGTAAASAVKIVNTVTYLHNGIFKSKTTAEVAFTATTHDIPVSASLIQEAKYLVCLDAAGTITLTMGAIAGDTLSLLPELPSAKTPIGYVLVSVAAGATKFTASTDLLSAGHLTVTYVNLGFLSPRYDATQ